ncbi:DUF1289 domain-containing protein [Sinisalibacter aestuarii]|uniref:DUF1289 domain-containing protein n=1 Tax=Sinisalibacter aestuarii TaxID=2949426 RepID=A0ABQ5LVP3_9RHOB|nr:DUF1289 domain-containing protein [Sinisalibacter aestuarii]GKY89060.1 hypothetical protein STA1M1_29290 [Sinisalibacter aestuarii]
MSEAPLTPCVQICVIHSETGLCTGCLRTRDEIARWSGMSNAERRQVMNELPSRAGAHRQRRGGRAGRLQRRENHGGS